MFKDLVRGLYRYDDMVNLLKRERQRKVVEEKVFWVDFLSFFSVGGFHLLVIAMYRKKNGESFPT